MAKNNSKKKPAPPEKKSKLNFFVGLVAGIAVVAIIAFAIQKKSSNPAPTPVATATSAQAEAAPAQPAMPPPPPEFDEAKVAAAPRIAPQEAKKLVDEGKAVVIDVRNVDDYTAGHIPGSLQIPLAYVQGEIPWFPTDKKLITVCT